ncbi:MAG: rhodanese-like domain-containing protein [Candidatus Binataceae bacterium]|jgi:rhodanese-related sulfurtransferase
MRTRLISIVTALAAALAVATPVLSFDLPKILGGQGDEENLNTFKIIHVADLSSLMNDKDAKIQIYDANGSDTRDKYGVIPGATMLPSADAYDVATTLPKVKSAPIVFYCANTHCLASHEAARRAVNAGYTNVSVMADGIMGWKAAGEPTTPPPVQTSSNS